MKDPKDDIFYKLYQTVITAYRVMGGVFIVVAFIVLIVNFSPNIWYNIDAGAVDDDTSTLLTTVSAEDLENKKNTNDGEDFTKARKLPAKDLNLPKESTLIINSIGVNARIHEGKDIEAELEKGVVRHYSSSTPLDNNGVPVYLMAHRFGYLSWSQEFRKSDSFYNLPKLKPGDEIIYIIDQRAFKYKVTQKFEAEGVINVNSDMVLYTCKFFNSETRVVITANLVNE